MISLGTPLDISTNPITVKPFDFAALMAAVEKFPVMPPKKTLHVREGVLKKSVPEFLGHDPIGQMYGIPVRVSKMLPETVKDKDGNEVELLGILMPNDMDFFSLDADKEANRMVMITGKVVKASTSK